MDVEMEIKEEQVWLEETADTSLDSYVNNTVDNDCILKVESLTSIIPKVENEALDPRSEGDVTTENLQLESTMTHLKEETKPDLMEPDPRQPTTDNEDELIIKEHPTDQLVPHIKGENSMKIAAVLTVHTGEMVHSCTLCGMMFPHLFNLEEHKLSHSEERLYHCEEYNSTFVTLMKSNNHLTERGGLHRMTNSGKQLYHCKECNSTFGYRSSLRCHILTHSGDRQFHCAECSCAFRDRSNLVNHMRTHAGQKPYRCEQCRSAFTRRGDLRRHMLTHSGERPYRCTKCNSSFNHGSNLRDHMVAHSGEKPYHCEKCSVTFSYRSNLRRHMLTHSGDKPLLCEECNSSFNDRSNFRRHMLTHSGERF